MTRKDPTLAIGLVLIGRNEGARFLACLDSLGAFASQAVYVDSGSTDGSVEAARARGLAVVQLPPDIPFTAARARNAGFEALTRLHPDIGLAQFMDGDCRLAPGWVNTAMDFLAGHEDVAIVCGRRREAHPDRSVYNRLCDDEWNTPVGEATACGGDCLVRRAAFEAVGGYRADLIAGEEPEMCLRLREKGWRIWRLNAEMTLHDADMRRFSQWWRRSVRAGHAFAEVSTLHYRSPKRIWAQSVRSIIFWGGLLPIIILASAFLLHPAFLGLTALYPMQIARIAMRRHPPSIDGIISAFFLVLGKFPEMQGVAAFLMGRLRGKRKRLIEYK